MPYVAEERLVHRILQEIETGKLWITTIKGIGKKYTKVKLFQDTELGGRVGFLKELFSNLCISVYSSNE